MTDLVVVECLHFSNPRKSSSFFQKQNALKPQKICVFWGDFEVLLDLENCEILL